VKTIQILFIVLLFAACSTTRNISVTAKPENLSYNIVAEKFQSQLHQYHSASFKAKVDIKEKKTQSFIANVRMVRDSIIWASLTGSLGVEGARIIITKDSIHILDKLKKIYYQKPFSYVQEFVPFTLSMNFLQDIMMGNHPLDSISVKTLSIKETYVITETGSELTGNYYIAPETFVPLLVVLDEKQNNRQLAIAYKDYRPLNDTDTTGKQFSFERIVDFKSGKKTKITIRFTKINRNEDLTFPFSVGEKYEIRF
jgi:hypothetical protein